MQQKIFEYPPLCKLQEVELDLIDISGTHRDTLYNHLTKTISEIGVLQSVVLVRNGARYKIAAGLRRVLASRAAGLEAIPAKVLDDDVSDAQISMITLAENMNRKTNPAHEAAAIAQLMNQYQWNEKDVAENMGIPVNHVKNRIRLLQLIPQLFEMLKRGELKVSAATKLARLPKERQVEASQEEKITTEGVEYMAKEETLKKLVHMDELFETPAATPLDKIIAELQQLIVESGPKYKEKLADALNLLQEVKICL